MPRLEADISADIDKLRAALGKVDARVTYDGNTREAKSNAEIRQALVSLESELVAVTGTKSAPRRRLFRTATGW